MPDDKADIDGSTEFTPEVSEPDLDENLDSSVYYRGAKARGKLREGEASNAPRDQASTDIGVSTTPWVMPSRVEARRPSTVPSAGETLKMRETEAKEAAPKTTMRGTSAEAPVSEAPAAAVDPSLVPPMPGIKRRPQRIALISFGLVVILPTLLAAVYYFFIAANQYTAEFHFTVRDSSAVANSSSSSGISSVVSSLGGSAAGADVLSNYTVIDYLQSRQALEDLAKHVPLRSYFDTSKADILARLRPKANMEQFTNYWRGMIYANYDPATGLAVVRIRTFDPNTTMALSKALMGVSEDLVNKIQDRSREASVNYANDELGIDRKLNTEMDRAALSLRKKEGIVDPMTGDVAVQIAEITQLTTTLAQLKSQYAAAATQIRDPDSPALKTLKDEIDSTQRQIDAARALTKGSSPLDARVGKFETLAMNRTLTSTAIGNSYANVEAARASADSQHLYLMDGVRPSFPTSSDFPNRPLDVFLVALAGLGIWLTGAMLISSLRSHMM